MKPLKLMEPKVPVELTKENFGSIEDEAFYQGCLFEGDVLSNKELKAVCFKQVRFVNVTFEDVSFDQLELIDVIFEDCQMSNIEMIGASIHRVHFNRTNFVGTNLSEALLYDTMFDNSYGNYSFFSYSTLKNVVFEGTSLIESDFFEVKWQKLQFDGCQLNGINFMQTNLKGIDLSTSNFEKIGLSFHLVKGCTINPAQALVVTHALGMKLS